MMDVSFHAGSLSGSRRWIRRVVPWSFFVVLVGAAYATAAPHHTWKPALTSFSHRYVANPPPLNDARVAGPPAPAGLRDTIGARINSLSQLSRRLPRGVLRRTGPSSWHLLRPVDVVSPGNVTIRSHASLTIGPGAYMEVSRGGVLRLQGLRVVGANRRGRPEAEPAVSRGFLLDDGGRLVLIKDDLVDLGHQATLSYGASFYTPEPGSSMTGCKVTGAYVGVFATQASGVHVADNLIQDSYLYGVDLHSGSHGSLVTNNQVTNSGEYGIVLDSNVRANTLSDNVVQSSRVHGIVLYNEANDNVLSNNEVAGATDGIVLSHASGNRLIANTLRSVRRFGIRISGSANKNTVQGNNFVDDRVGVYVYAKADGNDIVQSRFTRVYEQVRIRRDAKGNTVRPVPPRAELQSP